MPVSDAPKHVPGAYQELRLWTRLYVKQSKWYAQFTFRADQQAAFYIPIDKPKQAADNMSTSVNVNHIKACKINIITARGSSSLLSLVYQFLNDNLPISLDRTITANHLQRMANLNLAEQIPQPDPINNWSAGKFLFCSSIFRSL
jgi:hypothetical protein